MSISKSFALYIFNAWAAVLMYSSLLYARLLELMLQWMPNYLIPLSLIPYVLLHKTPVEIIRALDQEGNDITNKFKLFIGLQWDDEILDNGGVNIDFFIKCVNSTRIIIVYVLNSEIKTTLEAFSSARDENSVFHIGKLLQIIEVDIRQKKIRNLNGRDSALLFNQLEF